MNLTLRSASIVSSCTIPLDEEDEETANADSAQSSPSGRISNEDSTHSIRISECGVFKFIHTNTFYSNDSLSSGTFKHLQQQQGSSRRRRVPPPPPAAAPPPSASSATPGKLPEELECDETARELLERLRPGDAGCKKLTSLFGEFFSAVFVLPIWLSNRGSAKPASNQSTVGVVWETLQMWSNIQ